MVGLMGEKYCRGFISWAQLTGIFFSRGDIDTAWIEHPVCNKYEDEKDGKMVSFENRQKVSWMWY